MPGILRRIVIGRPLTLADLKNERLGNFSALAVFASDALSSVAYATEEILLVLMLAAPIYAHLMVPISLGIVILLWVVAISYRQTIHAYPTGGGAYTVAKENLGTLGGLVAGSSLLIDYVLTVAVSVAAGIAAITSAAPLLFEHRVALCVAAIGLVTVGNLRGVKESGRLFAAPAYGFMLALGALIVVGFFRYAFYGMPSLSVEDTAQANLNQAAHHPLTWFLLLRAFSSGCAALTGVEAISNGVGAFREPEAENAARVLRWLAMLLSVLFLGISVLAWLYNVMPADRETVISQLARLIFGRSWLYAFIQVSTCAILVLAANTSFAGFPRLASLMAKDAYLPRQLQNLGDRLVFSNAILLLAAAACFLIFMFGARVHALIPLYAVGVFLSFTLSQTGMVLHHFRTREHHWRKNLIINAAGAITTAVVLFAIVITKFTHGAWIVCVVIPILVSWFYAIHDHYRTIVGQLAPGGVPPPRLLKHTVVVPVAGIHKGVLAALEYARSLSKNIRAVNVAPDEESAAKFRERWKAWAPDIPLVVLTSPYRSLTEPLLEFIKSLDEKDPNELITVVIPSFVPARWWHNFLHNQSSIILQTMLRGMRNVVITSVRVHLDK